MNSSYRARRPAVVSTIAMLSLLSGCASFSGTPKPVLPTDTVVGVAKTGKYGLDQAVAEINSTSGGSKDYRNAFIAIQMAAIDARYYEFRRDLSRQSKGANFGLELGVLALTGVGSVVGTPLANVLSAGGAGLTGTKAALSKEVYFERTLPALLASIDAHRLEARAPLIAGLGKDIDAYPLAQAIADLFAYQNSASLEGAIERITATAAIEKKVAEEKYENVVKGCSRPEEGVGGDWDRFADGIGTLDPAATGNDVKLKLVSRIVGSDPALPVAEQRDAIIDAVEGSYCSRAAMAGLIDQVTKDAGVTFP